MNRKTLDQTDQVAWGSTPPELDEPLATGRPQPFPNSPIPDSSVQLPGGELPEDRSRRSTGQATSSDGGGPGGLASRSWRQGVSIRFCQEGWYYVFVLTFILGGAILREVNLLVILAGMMIGPLLMSWRISASAVRGLEPRRQLPRHAVAGETFPVEVELGNPRRRTAWAILVEDEFRRADAVGTSGEQCRVFVPRAIPGTTAKTAYHCTIYQRGRYCFTALTVTSRFPLGLIEARQRHHQFAELIVVPRLGVLAQDWLGRMGAEQAGGDSWQERRGTIDGDYYGLREWRSGDSKRWVHWRTSAKLNRLAVREFEQQRNRDLALVLDLYLPPDPTPQAKHHLELAISFAATAVQSLCRRGGCRLVVAVATGERTLASRQGPLASQPDEESVQLWHGPGTPSLLTEIHYALADCQGTSDPRLAACLDATSQHCRPGMRLVVISPREAASGMQGGTPAGGSRQPIVWLDVSDPSFESLFSPHWDSGAPLP